MATVLAVVSAGSATAGALLTGKQIKDGTITGKDIRNRSITKADLATGLLASLKPVTAPATPGAPTPGTTIQIPAGSVGAGEIKEQAVGAAQVQDESLTGRDIENGSITGNDLADGSVGSADIAEDSIGLADLSGAAEQALSSNGAALETHDGINLNVPAGSFRQETVSCTDPNQVVVGAWPYIYNDADGDNQVDTGEASTTVQDTYSPVTHLDDANTATAGAVNDTGSVRELAIDLVCING